ncbi:uncharacterized protein LOC144807715 [Lissotriton helveticus]
MEVPFRDASGCFSEDDWNLLQEWQKELCGNLMKEIHRALISLGPLIASTVFSLRTKGTQLLHPLDNAESERRGSVTISPSDSSTRHCELVAIKRERHVQLSNDQETERRKDGLSREEPAPTFIDHRGEEIEESRVGPDMGVPRITSVFSLCPRLKEESCVQETTVPEERTSGMSDLGSILVKESTTCNESRTQMLQIDDKRTVFVDGKKAIKRIGNRLYHQKYNTEKKRFPCTYCGKSFTQKSYLLRHQKTHSGEKTFSCTECQKSFTQLSILRLHYRSHTGEKPFTCNECGKTFTQQGGLKRHLKIHRGEVVKRFPCSECGKCFAYKCDLHRHENIHFKKSFAFKIHVQQNQTIQNDEKRFPCTECEENFTNQTALKHHLKSHSGISEKLFLCSECGKSFTQLTGFKRHLKTHMGASEKPFPCSECGKTFVYRSDFLRHQRIHFRKSPVFKSEDQQAQKVRNDWKPFPCTECGKGFTSRTGLKRHLKIHKGEVEKPFLCSECGRRCLYKSELERHQRIHTGEKPFDCTECGKSFSQRSVLRCHMRTHKKATFMQSLGKEF